jgi:hypothetical protein
MESRTSYQQTEVDMGNSAGFQGRSLALVVMVAAVISASSATAQDPARPGKAAKPPQVPTRVLFDNDKVRVQEVTFRPGDQGPNIPRPFRVIRVLEGGTMRHTYTGGRTETVVYRTGEVVVREAENNPYVPRNVGKSTIVFYVVALKEQKNN